jgi:hypothetical protein
VTTDSHRIGGRRTGETIDVACNSFLCIKGTAFNVRGTPANAAYFRHNVTSRATGPCYYPGSPVNEESDRDNVFVHNNVTAADPRRQLGVCDFDGDGRDACSSRRVRPSTTRARG